MAQKTIDFYIFDKDEVSGTLIENYLKNVQFPYQIHKYNEFDKSLLSKDSDSFKYIFLNVSQSDSVIFDTVQECALNPKNIFFMMSAEPSTDLYIKSLRVGVKEFLKKPLEKDTFISAVYNNFNKNMIAQGKIIKHGSRILSVTSLEKNCGKTFFSINLASELAFLSTEKVLLIDFNDNLNSVTFTLDLDQQFDTQYFVQNLTEENAPKLLPKLYRYNKSNLYIMSGCMYKASVGKSISGDNLQNFFDIVKKYFRYIVIDVNRDMKKTSHSIYGNSDMIFYVVSPNVAANSRNKNDIDANFDRRKFKVVLNKYRDKDENRVPELEKVLAREIFYKVPVNLSVTVGNGKGRTIREINEKLDILKKFNKLARYIIARV
ncbi:AAA family ATPase [bacterium]|nr:AAA family ATPase [bacterium]